MHKTLAVTIFAYIFASVGVFGAMLACVWREQRERRRILGGNRGPEAFLDEDLPVSEAIAGVGNVCFCETDALADEEPAEEQSVAAGYELAGAGA